MANQFGKVSVGITATTGGLTAGLQKASRQLDSFGGHVRAIRGRLTTLVAIQGGQLFGSMAGAAMRAARSLISMGQASAQTIDRTAKLSRQLGMSYAEMSALSLAADLSGSSMDEVGRAALLADRRFIEAKMGLATAVRGFEMAGVALADLEGLSSAERFQRLAEAIGALPTSAERAAAAMNIFGRSGANLLNLFENNGAVIGQSMEDVIAFGNALTNVQAGNVEAMNDAFARAGGAVSGIVTQVTAYLAPAIKTVIDQFTAFVGSVGGANIGQAIGLALLDSAIYLAAVGDFFIQNVGPILAESFKYGSDVAKGFYRVAEFLRGVFNAIQVGFGVIILGITGAIEMAASLFGGLPELAAFNDKMFEQIQRDAQQMGEAFGNAFGDETEQVGQAAATPLTDLLTAARNNAIEAARHINDQVENAEPPSMTTTVELSTKALKAIVVGTSEGEAFRNAIARGQDPRTSAQTDQQIAANTSRTADALEGLPDSLGSVFGQQIASASITV
jgi:hypothetical protein